MVENLSILNTEVDFDIETNNSDRAAMVLKSVVGAAPVVGPLLNEVITSVIPNQKQERIIHFLGIFANKVKFLEKDVFEAKIKTEEFTDLLEDALRQASRALTDDRKEYIASLLKNSIVEEKLTHIQKKRLLDILNELNDAEIIRLKSCEYRDEARMAFFEKHTEVLEPWKRQDSSQESKDRVTFWESLTSKLISTGVLDDHRNITGMGRLLLRFIASDEENQEVRI